MFTNFSFSLLISLISVTTPLSHASTLRQSITTARNDAVVSVVLWCVAKNNAEDSALQSALDWACGPNGGADCGPIQQGGPCYQPSDIQRAASFAFNDYFLKHGLTEDSCNFDNTAALTSLNPSFNNCKFPSSSTVSNGSFNGSTIVGARPATEDLSEGDYTTASRLSWALVTLHLLISITLVFLGL